MTSLAVEETPKLIIEFGNGNLEFRALDAAELKEVFDEKSAELADIFDECLTDNLFSMLRDQTLLQRMVDVFLTSSPSAMARAITAAVDLPERSEECAKLPLDVLQYMFGPLLQYSFRMPGVLQLFTDVLGDAVGRKSQFISGVRH